VGLLFFACAELRNLTQVEGVNYCCHEAISQTCARLTNLLQRAGPFMAHIDPLLHDTSRVPRRALVYALLAASMTAWIACPLHYLGLLKFVPSILISLEYLVIVLVAAISGAAAGYGPRLQFWDRETRHNSLRVAAVAVWVAPLMLLFLEHSAISGFLAAGIVSAGCALLGISTGESSDATRYFVRGTPDAIPTFPTTCSRPFVKELTRAILASALLQAAMLANFVHEYELALLPFAVGAALLAAQLRVLHDDSGRQAPAVPRSTYLFASATMATVVIVIGLLPLMGAFGQPANPLDAAIWKLLFRAPTAHVAHSLSVRIEQTRIRPDGYIGVILTPKHSRRDEATTLSQLSFRAHERSLMQPLTIPFTGSYWFFQYPFVRPPQDSITAEGDPAGVGVRSANYKPLLMEAVQNLYQPIETGKLGKVQLAMRDVDAFPGTVSVELVLVDTATWDHPAQSLGIKPLSTPTMIENVANSHSENMNFPVPQRTHCREFNQMRLIFRLDASRSRQAAAIAVQSFVLVPRGM
jgi:hypothetical protein